MRVLPALLLGSLSVAAATSAQAQVFLPASSFAALPTFAWPRAPAPDDGQDGTYARVSTGFQVTSSKHFGTSAGPTLGFEGGKLWRDGDLVYGVVGGFDYMTPVNRGAAPAPGYATWTRDFAGVAQFKVGTFVADNLFVYSKVGMAAVNETLRFGPSPVSSSFSRSDVVVRPDARVGAEWAITDRLTLGVEVGVAGPAIR